MSGITVWAVEVAAMVPASVPAIDAVDAIVAVAMCRPTLAIGLAVSAIPFAQYSITWFMG